MSSRNIYSNDAYVNIETALDDSDNGESGSELDEEERLIRQRKKEMNGLDIKYVTHRKRRSTKHPVVAKNTLKAASQVPVKLVPIRIDLEIEGVKLKDTFSWNLNETIITPENFAIIMAEDLDTQYAQQFAPMIASAIREQCATYCDAVEEDTFPEVLKRQAAENGNEGQQGGDFDDLRIVVKVDFNIGSLNFTDQFEWPLFSRQPPTPEDFARQLCADLGVGGHFIGHIAHQIREQVATARLNFDEATLPFEFKRPFRKISEGDEANWEPHIRELTADEIERLMKEQDRNSRRMRRSQKLTRGDRGAGMSMMSSRTTTNSNSLMMNPALHQTWKSMYSSQHEPKIPYQNYTPRGDDAALSHNFVSPNNASPDAPSNKGSGRRRSSSGFGSMPPLNTDLIKNQIELMIVHNVPQGGAAPNSAPSSAGSNTEPPHVMIPEQDEDEQQEHDVTGATTAVVSPNTSASAASPARRSSNSNPSPTTKASSGGGAVDKADQLRRMSMSSDSSQYSIGPKRHRGFGASARIFNENGDLEVGEFRKNWRCAWCLLSGKFTPTLRKGPLGSKTLCNACGIWYVKHGFMPEERYREHADTQ